LKQNLICQYSPIEGASVGKTIKLAQFMVSTPNKRRQIGIIFGFPL
jgi:hypothetical protein